ncbi:glycosyltransferase family 4 protein [Flavobacterium sp. DSR3-2]|uniref:glycosyltransferase family 4 protein n=1 Tax=Flavobacterium sp. DSR3-2 TaxID=2804634 RepID=UPI003CF6CCC4
MKILFFSHSFYPNIGGIETVSMQLVNNFIERTDVSIIVVCRTKEIGNLQLPFDVVRDPSIKKIVSLLEWCDVVFENNPCFGMSWVNFIIRKPKVVALHTWIVVPGSNITLLQKLKKTLLSDYNAVIACSNKIRSYTFEKALVIENAYDTALYYDKKEVKTMDFVFLGRLVSDKGADMCIELIQELKKNDGKEYSLTIIGDGPEMEDLKELTKNYNLNPQVRFLGFLKGIAIVRELNIHRFLLVPSRWEEPFGLVALEGLACGCIPIVSDGGGLPDAIGKAGVLFKRNSLLSLVQTTKKLLKNNADQTRLIQLANSHLNLHTQKEVSQRYFDVILKALKL